MIGTALKDDKIFPTNLDSVLFHLVEIIFGVVTSALESDDGLKESFELAAAICLDTSLTQKEFMVENVKRILDASTTMYKKDSIMKAMETFKSKFGTLLNLVITELYTTNTQYVAKQILEKKIQI